MCMSVCGVDVFMCIGVLGSHGECAPKFTCRGQRWTMGSSSVGLCLIFKDGSLSPDLKQGTFVNLAG